MKATAHQTLGVSPGALVFHRDMIMDLPFVADLLVLRNKGQQLIDYNLRRENYRRRNFDYQQGQWVLELTTNPGKLGPSTKGPYQPIQESWNHQPRNHTKLTGNIVMEPSAFDKRRIWWIE